MAILIAMPRLSPTMEEGVLAKWLKQEGDHITPGDILAEVETDKANMDFPLEDEGTLLKKLVSEGSTVKLGAPVGILGTKGEDISAILTNLQTPNLTTQAVQEGRIHLVEKKISTPSKQETPHETEIMIPSVQIVNSPHSQERILASPLAKRLAQEAHIELRQIQGTGPGGRIIKKDVEQIFTQVTSIESSPTIASRMERKQITPLSMMRKTIARRLVESKQLIPHFYLTIDIRMDVLWTLREQMNQSLQGSGIKISVNDFIAKATARALHLVPQANVSFSEEGIIEHKHVDLGIAVALPDGLLTPIVRQAENKSIGILSSEIRELAERGKQKKLKPEEYQGATFSISNLGMHGIQEFSAIINPPESGILAIGQVEKRPIIVEKEGIDQIIPARMMSVTLSCDHRVIDGALGAQLLAEIKKGLEQPFLLVL